MASKKNFVTREEHKNSKHAPKTSAFLSPIVAKATGGGLQMSSANRKSANLRSFF